MPTWSDDTKESDLCPVRCPHLRWVQPERHGMGAFAGTPVGPQFGEPDMSPRPKCCQQSRFGGVIETRLDRYGDSRALKPWQCPLEPAKPLGGSHG